MNERVFIIHGWGGHQNEAWIPWLKKELESRGYQVFNPAMPNTHEPVISKWVGFLDQFVGIADKHTHFVGHSIGCQTIMRYLQTLPAEQRVGKVVMVAGFFHLLESSYEEESEKDIARPWLEESLDLEKIKSVCSRIIAIFSDDDDCVPLSDERIFKKDLGAETIILHDMGHFSDSDNITELPEALNVFLE